MNVSHILTGRCVAKIAGGGGEPGSPSDVFGDGAADVTALYFSEERNELYVGNRQGLLHVWAQ